MTYRTKYYISIGLFAAATLYMLYAQGQVIADGYGVRLTTWDIIQMFISFAVLIPAIIAFVYYRSRKNSSDISEEELLMRATKQPDSPDRKPK